MNGFITKIQRFSLHDGPGIRTTVFLKGCPLTCVWCQNPETIAECPEVLFLNAHCIGCRKCVKSCPKKCFSWDNQIKFNSVNCNRCGLCIDNCPAEALNWSSHELSSDDIIREAIKDKLYYDLSGGGLTLSGGEPLAQIGFCYELAKKAKSLGLHITIDTSGYVPRAALEKIMPFVDLFLFDIKFVDRRLHQKYTGQPNDLILGNFQLLCKLKKLVIVRVPVITGITDRQDNLFRINDFIKQIDPAIKIDYIPFNALMLEKYKMLGKTVLAKI
jgi:pyruvate formate lyase activating enzyme